MQEEKQRKELEKFRREQKQQQAGDNSNQGGKGGSRDPSAHGHGSGTAGAGRSGIASPFSRPSQYNLSRMGRDSTTPAMPEDEEVTDHIVNLPFVSAGAPSLGGLHTPGAVPGAFPAHNNSMYDGSGTGGVGPDGEEAAGGGGPVSPGAAPAKQSRIGQMLSNSSSVRLLRGISTRVKSTASSLGRFEDLLVQVRGVWERGAASKALETIFHLPPFVLLGLIHVRPWHPNDELLLVGAALMRP